MEITEVRTKLMREKDDMLQAFSSIIIDSSFAVHDLKLLRGDKGLFVSMPSRKLTAHCPRCKARNHLRANYCNQCGYDLRTDRATTNENGRSNLFADIAHPINDSCRAMIHRRVEQAYRDEVERSRLSGYVSSYDNF